MITYLRSQNKSLFSRILSAFMVVSFVLSMSVVPVASAQSTVLGLPTPGSMVSQTPGFNPTIINGIILNPENPLKFDFLVDRGDRGLDGLELEAESSKLIKYFMASLTLPEEDMWVNLSPYESERIIPDEFAQTEMGRDLLAQDYMLKQLTASLMYPEEDLGHEFWQRIYEKAEAIYGTTDIPMNTFNKVWIIPEKAVVYEHEATAFIMESRLKVLLEEDYLAFSKNEDFISQAENALATEDAEVVSGVSSEIVRDLIIPEIEREVNEGALFANLRQIYHSMILAKWYKENLKDSFLGQTYVDQAKVAGVDHNDPEVNQKIYDQYLEAFKKGAYNYIKEDYDPTTQQVIPRKYFSGGFDSAMTVEREDEADAEALARRVQDPVIISAGLDGVGDTNVSFIRFGDSIAVVSDEFTSRSGFFADRGAASVAELERARERFQADVERIESDEALTAEEKMEQLAIARAERAITSNGGFIALDESKGSTTKKMNQAETEDTFEKRQDYRRIFMEAPLAELGISGAILHDEHFLYTHSETGENLAQSVRNQGVMLGWKSDNGMKLISDLDPEYVRSMGIDPEAALDREKLANPGWEEHLDENLDTYIEKGIEFTKWRTEIPIYVDEDGNYIEREDNVRAHMRVLAVTARKTIAKGITPVLEPEVMITGAHDIAASFAASRYVLDILDEELEKEGVNKKATQVKTSKAISGKSAENRAGYKEVGRQTGKLYLLSIDPDIAKVELLSGGQTVPEGKANLQGIQEAIQNDFKAIQAEVVDILRSEGKDERADRVAALTEFPWDVAQSYGRGYQDTALKTWMGDELKIAAARAAFIADAEDLQEARLGVYEVADAALTAEEKMEQLAIARAERAITSNGGFIALDESKGSTTKKMNQAETEDTFEKRQDYRRIFMEAPLAELGISGAILHDEHFLYTHSETGENLAQSVRNQGVMLGWKSDNGMKLISDLDPEYVRSMGIDPEAALDREKLANPGWEEHLDENLDTYIEKGIEFTKWRTEIPIYVDEDGNYIEREDNVRAHMRVLAVTARKTIAKGITPVLEPEVMITGAHDIAASFAASRYVLDILDEELEKEGVNKKATQVKTSKAISGKSAENRAGYKEVGRQTGKLYLLSIDPDIAKVELLSGGQTVPEGKANLQGIQEAIQNDFKAIQAEVVDILRSEGKDERADRVAALTEFPWDVAQSYGRGYQDTALKTWMGDELKIAAARAAFIADAEDLQEARIGVYDVPTADAAITAETKEKIDGLKSALVAAEGELILSELVRQRLDKIQEDVLAATKDLAVGTDSKSTIASSIVILRESRGLFGTLIGMYKTDGYKSIISQFEGLIADLEDIFPEESDFDGILLRMAELGFDPIENIDSILRVLPQDEDAALTAEEKMEQLAIARAERAITSNGGFIALDESKGSTTKKMNQAETEDTFEKRQDYRRIFMEAPLAELGISGAILHDEHFLYTHSETGENLAQSVRNQGVMLGWKSDNGMKLISDLDPEYVRSMGIDPEAALDREKLANPGWEEHLDENLDTYIEKGIEFTKWRTEIPIYVDEDGNYIEREDNVRAHMRVLAVTARKTIAKGITPVLEPEVMITGAHDIAASFAASRYVLDILDEELEKEGVNKKATQVKTSKAISGKSAENRAGYKEVGRQTGKLYLLSIDPDIAKVELLSGGQTVPEGKANLQGIQEAIQNDFKAIQAEVVDILRSEGKDERADRVAALTEFPWDVAQSYGRGYQDTALKTWMGDELKIAAARAAFIADAEDLQEARLGVYEVADAALTADAEVLAEKDLTKKEMVDFLRWNAIDTSEALPSILDAVGRLDFDPSQVAEGLKAQSDLVIRLAKLETFQRHAFTLTSEWSPSGSSYRNLDEMTTLTMQASNTILAQIIEGSGLESLPVIDPNGAEASNGLLFVIQETSGPRLFLGGLPEWVKQDEHQPRVVMQDNALVANPGGIDFNPDLLDLERRGSGLDIQMAVPQIPMDSIRIDGFAPVIIDVTPVLNLPLLLGLGTVDNDSDVGYLPELDPADNRAKAVKELEELSMLN